MGLRSYVPFDAFSMRVEVPVSALVRDGDFGWTCGQCPLDHAGEVLAPGNLAAQAGHVCDMIESTLHRGGFTSRSIGKLNVYFAENNPGEGDLAIDLLARRFPHHPVIVPIPVPHFYYDGMMIEVDVFTGTNADPRKQSDGQGIDLQIVDGGAVIWASVRAALTSDVALADRLAEISSALDQQGLPASRRLCDHWFVSGNENELADLKTALFDSDLVTNPHAVVRSGSRPTASIVGELTFARETVEATVETDTDGKLSLYRRRCGASLWVSGVQDDPQSDLVEQTRQIMTGIERSLASNEMTFANVVKLTAHYVGGASAEELHGNMTVRHSFYGSPGPASTGLPVTALHNPHCKIAINVTALA